MKRGWWELKITGDIDHYTLDDISKEHIANMILEGYDQGELNQDDDDEDPEMTTGEELFESKRENDK